MAAERGQKDVPNQSGFSGAAYSGQTNQAAEREVDREVFQIVLRCVANANGRAGRGPDGERRRGILQHISVAGPENLSGLLISAGTGVASRPGPEPDGTPGWDGDLPLAAEILTG